MSERDFVTKLYFPNKLTLVETLKIMNKADNIETFLNNIGLTEDDTKYPEEWAKLYCQWLELN